MTGDTVVTPEQVEWRLVELGKELDTAHHELVACEHAYYKAKSEYEVGVARVRLAIGRSYAERGVKVTVQEREDEALIQVADLLTAWHTSEAMVRAARANIARVRTHIDIARSVGTSVRAALDIA